MCMYAQMCLREMEEWKTYLFLKSTRHQSSQLRQTIIDPVTSPFLNYLQMGGESKSVI